MNIFREADEMAAGEYGRPLRGTDLMILSSALDSYLDIIKKHAVMPSSVWVQVFYDLTIRDPDGWDRKNYAQSWAEPISFTEFQKRVFQSTTEGGTRVLS